MALSYPFHFFPKLQSARSLLDLEDLLDSNIRSLTYVHLGAAAMRTAKLVQQLGSSNGVAAAALDPRAVRQLQRLMKQLEGLYERAMPMLPVRWALLPSNSERAVCWHVIVVASSCIP